MTAASALSAPAGRQYPGDCVLGIGGTLRPNSSSEAALAYALRLAAEGGARTRLLTARDLDGLPMYDPARVAGSAPASQLIEAAREADKVIIATPGYHGGMSGLLKNALDYLQELAGDEPAYLHGRAVGCIVTAAGWQAAATTLGSLRSTVHALRGWPTPLGVAINSATPQFDATGRPVEDRVERQLRQMVDQLLGFVAVPAAAS